MKVHLDTSFLIRALVRGSPEDQRLRAWVELKVPLAMSAVAWAEFLCGPLDATTLQLARQIVPERVPFTEMDAQAAAELFNRGGRRRGTLADCMIAACAQREGAALASSNSRDFERLKIKGLEVLPP